MQPQELAKQIADKTGKELQTKFLKGQLEHGGDFAKKPTVQNIREEVLDLVNYTYELIEHRTQLLIELEELIDVMPGLNTSVAVIRLQLLHKHLTKL